MRWLTVITHSDQRGIVPILVVSAVTMVQARQLYQHHPRCFFSSTSTETAEESVNETMLVYLRVERGLIPSERSRHRIEVYECESYYARTSGEYDFHQ